MTLEFLEDKLNERRENGNLRSLSSPNHLKDFVSNDYLGLASNKELAERIKARYYQEESLNGGTGSRLLSGNHRLYKELEELLIKVFLAEAVLVFNSGYAANQGLVSAVSGKGDTILYDQLSHVCLKEGAWLSKAESISFRHNDLEDLKSKITRAKGKVFILTESVFSMDGDTAPLREIVDLCEEAGAYLIVDEAHSSGSYGAKGGGMLVKEGIQDRVFARVYTFGKGMGVHGACVVGSKVLIDYLVNFSRTFIYTTSLPPHSILSIEESFKYLDESINLQDELQQKIDSFARIFTDSISKTAIQPVLIGSNELARKISSELQQAGFDVRPILSPTVKKGTERLRISLHTHNTNKDIEELASKLMKLTVSV